MMERIEALRHTAAHVMAQAVMRLWPDAKLAIGPAIKDGFYYDFDLEHRLTSEDLSAIEGEMRKIVKEELPLIREELSKAEAVKLFTRMNQPYKLELLAELPEQVSVYRQGEFVDLCQGPHVDSTAQVKHFKLQTVAGAYWRGDSSRPMLQRIYGTAFSSREDLEAHLRLLEEAAKRDHRKLGRELDLFSIQTKDLDFLLPPQGNGDCNAPRISAREHQAGRPRGEDTHHAHEDLCPLRPLGQLSGEHVFLRNR